MADHPLKPATDRRLGRPLPHQLPNPTRADPKAINLSPPRIATRRAHTALNPVSQDYSVPSGTFPRVTHPSAAIPEGIARLACVKPAASVRSEPGSNSQVESSKKDDLDVRTSAHRPDPTGPGPKRHRLPCIRSHQETERPTNGEADTRIIEGLPPNGPTCKQSVHRSGPNRPHIPSSLILSKSARRQPRRCVLLDASCLALPGLPRRGGPGGSRSLR